MSSSFSVILSLLLPRAFALTVVSAESCLSPDSYELILSQGPHKWSPLEARLVHLI